MSAIILVIDDDATIVHLLKEFLEVEGFKVVEGYDGDSALRLAAQMRPNLIIIDLNLPGTDGLAIVESIRTNPSLAKIPAIFLTGESSKRVLPRLQHLPAVTHLEKPVELDRLNLVV